MKSPEQIVSEFSRAAHRELGLSTIESILAGLFAIELGIILLPVRDRLIRAHGEALADKILAAALATHLKGLQVTQERRREDPTGGATQENPEEYEFDERFEKR